MQRLAVTLFRERRARQVAFDSEYESLSTDEPRGGGLLKCELLQLAIAAEAMSPQSENRSDTRRSSATIVDTSARVQTRWRRVWYTSADW